MTITYPNEWQEEIDTLIDRFEVEEVDELLFELLKQNVISERISTIINPNNQDISDEIQSIIEQTEGEAS
jgi:hypothetical protein